MKPAAFEYYDPATTEEALALLAELGDEAKALAGGQSRFGLSSCADPVTSLPGARPRANAMPFGDRMILSSVPMLATPGTARYVFCKKENMRLTRSSGKLRVITSVHSRPSFGIDFTLSLAEGGRTLHALRAE